MQKVYIETSVISYYTSKTNRDVVVAGHQVSTKDFWNKLITNELIPVISALVIKEASQGNIEFAKKRRDAIQGFLVLNISKEAEELSSLLIKKHGIPGECPEDALHIAIAAVEKIDFIATWNFKHINNPFTKNKIKEIIEGVCGIYLSCLGLTRRIIRRMIMKDPIVAEVRKYRMEHTEKFNFDIHAICDDLRKYQENLYSISEIDKSRKFANKTLQRTQKVRR